MATVRPGALADIIEQLQTRGVTGAEVVRRLAEADRLITQSESHLGFTSAAQRHKARAMAAEGRRLFHLAMTDATCMLAEESKGKDVPNPRPCAR